MQREQRNLHREHNPPGSVWLMIGAITVTFMVMIALTIRASDGASDGQLLAALGIG